MHVHNDPLLLNVHMYRNFSIICAEIFSVFLIFVDRLPGIAQAGYMVNGTVILSA